MKKLLLLPAMLFLIGASAFSQYIEKGDWTLGLYGNIGKGQFSDIDNSGVTRFRLSPDIGFAFTDKLIGGLRLDYSSTKLESLDDANTSFSLAPFVRYYFLPKTNKVNLYGDVSYGFGSEGAQDKQSFNYFGVMAGPSYFMNGYTALEGTLNYRTYGGDAYNDTRVNSYGLWVGFQSHLNGPDKKEMQTGYSPNIRKGNWQVGGDLWAGFSKYEDIDESKTTYFSLDPEFGYFFMDRFVGGLKFEYSSEKAEIEDDAFTEFTIRPYLQYYFFPATNKINLFANGSYGFGSEGQVEKQNFNFYQIKAGPVFFLNPYTGLEAGLYYKSYSGEAFNDENFNEYGLRLSLQIHLNGGGVTRTVEEE